MEFVEIKLSGRVFLNVVKAGNMAKRYLASVENEYKKYFSEKFISI
ncbi:hypothetical protein OXIME_000636 [Oxyplasma meridianum]|uniref:Transposase n=1 Tax=Oxyplasma meridianum TaxID=3073602 RepID=A0AAX4NGI8_9ARCH